MQVSFLALSAWVISLAVVAAGRVANPPTYDQIRFEGKIAASIPEVVVLATLGIVCIVLAAMMGIRAVAGPQPPRID